MADGLKAGLGIFVVRGRSLHKRTQALPMQQIKCADRGNNGPSFTELVNYAFDQSCKNCLRCTAS
ncbi:hypothetical protein D3C71_1992300 [compost metagenome]